MGHEAMRERFAIEKRQALSLPADTSIADLLVRGRHLSAQAAALLRALERSSRPPDPELDAAATAKVEAGHGS
jgi:hypothetical protein